MLGYYVMRHFERDNDPSFFTNLTLDGHRRARALYIPGVERVVTSPFKRCVQSAQYFAKENDIPVKIACALGEYIDDDCHGIGLEDPEELRRRVGAFVEADAPLRSKCTLYVTHASVAEALCPGETFNCGDLRYVSLANDWDPPMLFSDSLDLTTSEDSDDFVKMSADLLGF